MDINQWWSSWAPLWDQIENRHFSTFITDEIINELQSPLLVIGAGQGIIVRYLLEKGFEVTGLDLNKTMVDIAREKYQLELVLGDAADLPFTDNSYNSVIISSGVVDYGAEEGVIKKILHEAKRVSSSAGALFTAFYQIDPQIEKMYRKIGVIDRQGNYRMKRIFEIDRISRKNPISCIFPIRKWTKKNIFRVIFEWAILGLTLPQELITERDKIFGIIESGSKMGITKASLLESVPDCVPYRTPAEIEELLNRLNIVFQKINKFNDCVLVTI